MQPDELGIELAARAWWRGGSARCRSANADRDGPRGVVCELHRANAMLVRARSGREGGWRGEVHGAAHSGELSQNSGEPLPWLGVVSLRVVVSMGCATRRRSEEEDRGRGGEPGRRLSRWRSSRADNGAVAARRSAALLWGEERRMEAAAEVGERVEGVGGRGGTRGPPEDAWRAASATYDHAAVGFCRDRHRHVCAWGREEADADAGRAGLRERAEA
jgi:hypothetical protein